MKTLKEKFWLILTLFCFLSIPISILILSTPLNLNQNIIIITAVVLIFSSIWVFVLTRIAFDFYKLITSNIDLSNEAEVQKIMIATSNMARFFPTPFFRNTIFYILVFSISTAACYIPLMLFSLVPMMACFQTCFQEIDKRIQSNPL